MPTGIGIELGPTAVRAVVLEGMARAPSARVKVLACRELPCETASPDALTQALIQLRRALSLKEPVVLGVPSTSAILTTVTPLVANPRRADLAVQFELQQHLPFELAEAVWHFRWLARSRLQAPGSRQTPPASSLQPRAPRTSHAATAVVAAMKRSLLDERLACCRRVGLAVRAVAINPIATLNAWDTQSVSAASTPVVLLNLLNDPTAEWIIRTSTQLAVMPVASSLPQSPSAQAPQAGEAFLQELAASWEMFQQQFPDLPQKIWLMGSSAALPRLSEAIAARLRLEVEAVRLTRAAAVNANLDQVERWTVAIGLGLQGLGLAPLSLNLLESSQSDRRNRQLRRGAMMTSAVCAAMAIGLGLDGLMEVQHRRTQILQWLDRQVSMHQTLKPDALMLLRHQQQIEARSAQLEQVATEQALLTDMLAQVAETLPDRVWLTKFEGSKNGVIEGLLEGRGRSFQDVTQLLDRLKSVAGMTTIKPLSTQVIPDPGSGKELIAFSVQVQRQRAAALEVSAPSATPGKGSPERR